MTNSDRDERRAAALRANLRRRKGQARESAAAVAGPAATPGDAGADPAPAPAADQPPVNDPAA